MLYITNFPSVEAKYGHKFKLNEKLIIYFL